MLKLYSKLVQFENLLSKLILLFSVFSLGNMKLLPVHPFYCSLIGLWCVNFMTMSVAVFTLRQ